MKPEQSPNIGNKGPKPNRLLGAPETISEEEIEKMDKSWSATFFSCDRGCTLRYKNGQVSFTVEYFKKLPSEMDDKERSKFSVAEKTFGEGKGKVFTYRYGKTRNDRQRESSIGFEPEYHVSKPRDFKEDTPEAQQMTAKELSEFIKDKKIVFYTGAGISAEACVYNMTQLMKILGIDKSKPIDDFTQLVLNNPAEAQEKFQKFCESAFENEPTKAHIFLAELAKLKQTKILTENFDLLQERTGVKPYHTEEALLRKDIEPEWFKEIDAIICIGLSYDDRGLLAWYKENNPSGKIVSLDLAQPAYLGEDDFWVKGNLQKTLPQIEK